ncbi:hypothetical protein GE21DRAFT_1309957 [Neurospora crassa]|uniref:Uncharacterized protein B24N4.050 n=1 Tax=Neurospora crassa TaxID=5141 RepID=Q6MWR1_NEUCS|nr:hypothetical protein GE21DRAFT_1309957 [Neurospora crassa]CAE75696.1 hypothetical protein [Neurospora crassa]
MGDDDDKGGRDDGSSGERCGRKQEVAGGVMLILKLILILPPLVAAYHIQLTDYGWIRLPACPLFQWSYGSECNEPGKMKGHILILERWMKGTEEEMEGNIVDTVGISIMTGSWE